MVLNMNTVKFLILFLTINLSYAQTIKGVVKDSITGKSIAFANVVLKNGKGTYTNEFGNFELKIKNINNGTLKISTIGYQSRILPTTSFTTDGTLEILLQPEIENLDEVIISSKIIKYGERDVLGEKRDGNMGVTSLIGYETTVLIENPKNRTGKVNGVYIQLKKRKDAEYVATFNLKFYEFDSITNSPGKLLYHENLYVQPKNKKYKLWVDVKDLGILFPESGICLGVEMVNTSGKVKKYAYFGPRYRYTFTEEKDLKTWSNYHNTGWRDGSIEYKNPKRTKVGVLNPMIGVEVEYILK